MTDNPRLVSAEKRGDDTDASIRPLSLLDFTGQEAARKNLKIFIEAATARAGLLTTPLRDRFGIPIRLNFYTTPELESIVVRGARVMNIPMTPEGANEIARRSRGTPRIAGRLLRRVRDFAIVDDNAMVT